jgi:ribonucleotide reductase alpha subunit
MSMQSVSCDVLAEKYAKGSERTIDDVLGRVARALAQCEEDPGRWEETFLAAMRAGFIPGGRVLSAAGTDIQATLINCFVQPIGDAMRGEESAKPGIEAFVHAKDQGGELANFNLSVAVTDAFLSAVHTGEEWDLVHAAEPSAEQQEAGAYRREDGTWCYGRIDARTLWEQIMGSTYDHAEPGVLFLDRANAENNLAYCEYLKATNPCAEEWLPDYGCCCLGSIDLTCFVRDPFTQQAAFDTEAFAELVPMAVRLLDNVLGTTYWPLPQQAAESCAKRRIGLGVLGLGDALLMLGLGYDTQEGRRMAARIAEALRDAAYLASAELAREKGAFPLFDAEKYLQGAFAARLPEPIRERIRECGLRNSHLLAIAPTGTIALAFADNASNGIEPAFAWTYQRRKRAEDGSWQEYRACRSTCASSTRRGSVRSCGRSPTSRSHAGISSPASRGGHASATTPPTPRSPISRPW